MVDDNLYLLLSAVLFTIGAAGLLIRRNPLVMFMCVELMLNAANINFAAFGAFTGNPTGVSFALFSIAIAAAEVVVGLGIIVAIMRRRPGATADDVSLLRG